LVAIAPGRAARPGAAQRVERPEPPTVAELEACPFCEGHEDRTPPETFAIGPPERPANAPGWLVRVVPNLYPALERQEVLVHSPRHVTSVADLTAEEIAGTAEAWVARSEAARAEGFSYVHASFNEGRGAGASLAHSHSQFAWFRELPPLVAEEAARLDSDGCVLCALLERERNGPRVVSEQSGVTVLAAYAGRLPYELLIAGGHEPGPEFHESAIGLVADSLRRLHAVEGIVPVNAWLHSVGHPHIELVPRLSTLASLELGTGIFVNSLAPEEAAKRLRETG
jgi:UDPglucose--hexose-1-phosphate uridylyltransferase